MRSGHTSQYKREPPAQECGSKLRWGFGICKINQMWNAAHLCGWPVQTKAPLRFVR
jgi:hypothetical protein